MQQSPNSETLEIARYELKYAVHPSILAAVLQRVERYCRPDSNTPGEWSIVNSLYFDSPGLRCYYAGENEEPRRYKIRVRTYGSTDAPIKLEIKRREGETVIKTSALVTPEQWRRLSPHGLAAITAGRGGRHAEFINLIDSIRATPKMLVTYDRLAFTSMVDDYVRITFDSKVRCQRMSALDPTGNPRCWRYVDDAAAQAAQASSYMMELKFTNRAPRWLFDIVNAFGLKRQGYSKYCRAVARFILGRESAWDMRPARPLFALRPSAAPAPTLAPASTAWRRI